MPSLTMNTVTDRTTWLRGDRFHCLQPPVSPDRQWRLVLLGPPGVGKGTQARLLEASLGACPLSTAEVFRAVFERSPTLTMAYAQERMNRGLLLADDFVLDLVRNRRACLRCPAGFLLDGFPRTLAQAAALDALLALEHTALDAVISYDLPFPDLIARMTGRRVCPRCHAIYHLASRPPKTSGRCDHCGGELVHLPDDEPTAIRTRLIAYTEATEQVEVYYRRAALLITVSAADDPQLVLARTLALLADRGLPVPARSA